MTEYEQQARDFCAKHGVIVEVEYQYTGPHFPSDKDDNTKRDVYRFTIKTRQGAYGGMFGSSIHNTGRGIKPAEYDILACLTKNDPGTFDDFCADFGYDTDSRRAEQTYFEIQKEWAGVRRLFDDEQLEELREIS